MDIRELFIGAIVRAKIVKWDYDDPELSEPMQVMAIDATEPHNLSVDLGFGDGMVAHSAFVEDLVPVPLTEELKTQYKKYVGPDVTHVHQLQQALRKKNIDADIIVLN